MLVGVEQLVQIIAEQQIEIWVLKRQLSAAASEPPEEDGTDG